MPPPRSPSFTAIITGYGLQELAAVRCKRTLCQFATATGQEGADEDSHWVPSPPPCKSDPPHHADLVYFVGRETFDVRSLCSRCQNSNNHCLNPANNSFSKLVTTLVDCHRPCRDLGNPGKTQNKPRALPDNPRSRQKRISTGTEEHCPGDEGKESEHRKARTQDTGIYIRNRGSTEEDALGQIETNKKQKQDEEAEPLPLTTG